MTEQQVLADFLQLTSEDIQHVWRLPPSASEE
jgi:hypothetical protein